MQGTVVAGAGAVAVAAPNVKELDLLGIFLHAAI